ncbi:hypothetical protein HTV45_03830 [Streptomyces sp. CHD11]|nr:hypothetical protein [Streptomyces sp. CHD11]
MINSTHRMALAHADAAGDIDWLVRIDSTIVRAHRQTNQTITPSTDPEAG